MVAVVGGLSWVCCWMYLLYMFWVLLVTVSLLVCIGVLLIPLLCNSKVAMFSYYFCATIITDTVELVLFVSFVLFGFNCLVCCDFLRFWV